MSNDYMINEKDYLTKKELILLLLMSAKLEISSGDFPNAKKHISEAESILEQELDKSLECLALNINAALHNKQGHYSRAGKFLRKAADLAITLPAELRLLTLSNISILLESDSPDEAIIYKNAAEKLKSELEYNNWWN
jgi:ATP/maltotriose-dependent transcriptional regulator MalT